MCKKTILKIIISFLMLFSFGIVAYNWDAVFFGYPISIFIVCCSFITLICFFGLTYLFKGNKTFFISFTCIAVFSVVLCWVGNLVPFSSLYLRGILFIIPAAYVFPFTSILEYFGIAVTFNACVLMTVYIAVTYSIFLLIWFSGKLNKPFRTRKGENYVEK